MFEKAQKENDLMVIKIQFKVTLPEDGLVQKTFGF